MLFMSEFWERFAFYGIRWALVLYIVAQFYGGNQSGQADANLTYGSYLALVYAGAIFGGYVADKIIGYQRSILVGATFMAAGLFYWLAPKLWKTKLYSVPMANMHFWLGLVGILLYVASMWVSGITQGLMLNGTTEGGALLAFRLARDLDDDRLAFFQDFADVEARA